MLSSTSSTARAVAAVALAALALASSGCLAASARLHGGPVVAGDRVAFQVGATVGLGITTSRAGAVLGNVGFATGGAPKAGLVDGIEYVRVTDPDRLPLTVRGGFGGVIALAGDPSLLGLHLGTMYVLRDRGRSFSGHEKSGGGGWSRSLLGVGVETRAGFAMTEVPRDTPGPMGDDDETRTDLGASVSMTVEYLLLGQTSLF